MNKIKKVLFITNIPAPYRVDFYNELGKQVDLTVIFEAKGASDQGIRFNWNIESIQNFKAIFLSNGDIRERKIDFHIFKYLKKKYYDIIVTTNYSYFTEMVALLYLKLRRIPYYMETDGGLIRSEESIIKKLYKTFLVSGAKGYFSPSKNSDDYLAYYGANRECIHRYSFTSLWKKDVLSRPVTKQEKDELRQRLGIKEKKVVISVGQFIFRKGYDVLLKASSKLDKEIGVYIIGGTATEEYLQMKSKLQLDHVHFLEFMNKDQLSEYYKLADLFVLPTREDIWGLVINEALAFGLPVVTTNRCVAGLELIRNNENGIIVAVEDSGALVEAIEFGIAQEGWNKVSLEIAKEYTIENMVKQHIAIFDEP